jgi:hypothetical protein
MPTRILTDASGTWEETYTVHQRDTGVVDADGAPVMETIETRVSLAHVAESAAFTASKTAERTAGANLTSKLANNRDRIRTLGLRAARFAKDPAANAADQLSARLQHELLARLALAEAADDV